MSSNPSSEGVFFVDQQPAAAPAAVAPVAPAPAPAPEPPADPTPATAPTGGAMRDVPLGTLIFRAGLLAEEQLEDALQEGMRTGKRLGEVLAERGLIKDTDLGRLLAGQQGLPYVEAAALTVDPSALARLPENIARMQNALAFGFEDGAPVVAVADPTNELVVENVRRALGVEPRLVVAAHGELARKIQDAYSQPAQPVAEPAPAVAPVEAPQPVSEAPAPAPPVEAAVAPAAPAEPQLVTAEPDQPAPAPVVTPMPTTVPPPEERAPEPQVAVEPAVVAPAAATEVPPLHAEAAVQQPVAQEPSAPQPVAAPAPAVAPETPPAQPAAAPVVPPPAEQPPAQPAPAEPLVVVAETPPAAQPAEQPAAPAPGVFTQATDEALAPTAPMTPPVAEEPAPAAAPAPAEPTPAPAPAEPTHSVVLRLTGDDRVEIGAFVGPEEAESFARTVVGRISRAEEQAEWPLFNERFIRPQTIVSVDVVEQSGASWTGSSVRSRWGAPDA